MDSGGSGARLRPINTKRLGSVTGGLFPLLFHNFIAPILWSIVQTSPMKWWTPAPLLRLQYTTDGCMLVQLYLQSTYALITIVISCCYDFFHSI